MPPRRILAAAVSTSLLCAGASAAAPATAADVRLAPEPVEYVVVCDAYGFGFYRIPGTDTCLRVHGRMRFDFNVFDYDPLFAETQGFNGTFSRSTRAYRYRARFNLYMDSRTSTEFGLLRTFADIQFQADTTAGAVPDEGTFAISAAYMEFGALTFGRAQSRYDFVDAFFAPGQAFLSAVSDTTTNLAALSLPVGERVRAIVSLESEVPRRYGIAAAAPFRNRGGYAGTRYPDPVAVLRIEDGWGSAQVMGALHAVRARRVADSAVGYALGGGAVFNLPVGAGTVAGFQGTFARGALQYAGSTLAGGRRIGGVFYGPVDAIIDSNGDLALSDALSVMAGFSTSFARRTSLSFEAGYAHVDQPETDLDGNGTRDDLDFQSFAVDGSVGYSPVSGLLFALGAQYKHVDMAEGPDFGGFSTFFRAQRLF